MASAAKPNWFAIGTSAAVVVVLIVVGILVVWLNTASTAPGPAPAASNIDTETGAIAFGDGPDTVDTYVDFMCPICNTFEQTYGETLNGLADDNSITLNVHPVSILDARSQGTQYSTRAANAMYCVAEKSPDAAMAFMQSMYKNQPAEGSPGLSDEEILDLADAAGAEGVSECIAERPYDSFIAEKTELMPADSQGRRGTPTVAVNGDRIDLTGDPEVAIVGRIG